MADRILIFVRHGEYHLDDEHPEYGALTPLGSRQARRVAKRLAAYPVAALHSSSMPRALETAAFIRSALGRISCRSTHLLREGIPLPYPGITAGQRTRMARSRQRMERAFARYFRPTRGADRYEVLVCHGNVIRYFIRRALRDDPGLWWRYFPVHCALTIFVVPKTGKVGIRAVNDVGHLPLRMQTI